MGKTSRTPRGDETMEDILKDQEPEGTTKTALLRTIKNGALLIKKANS